MLQAAHQGVWRLLRLQIIVVLIVTILMSFMGIRAFYSSLLGGTICVLGNLCFAKIFFAYSGARAAKKILYSMYLGETFKFIITLMLFFVATKYLRIQALPFFLSYIITQNVFWFSFWFFNK